jgi:hypothetical protein
MSGYDSSLPAHQVNQEPYLSFHPERENDRDIHPLKGLKSYGPYSRSLVSNVMDPIRIGFIVPNGTSGKINPLFKELRNRQQKNERHRYLIDYPGFSSLYGVNIVPSSEDAWIELPERLDQVLQSVENPHETLAETFSKAISSLTAYRVEYDIILIYLPKRWEHCFEDKDSGFDLHDHIKAVASDAGIPTQIIKQDGALNYSCRASVMWRLSIALYSKAGGVPWKMFRSEPNTAYVGLSYALKKKSSSNRFVTCCSQVFDSSGAGLQFLAYDAKEARVIRDNPFLSRQDMNNIITRSIMLYADRHNGQTPDRLVVHKNTEFKDREIKGCFDAWSKDEKLSLIQIQKRNNWRGIKIKKPEEGNRGDASNYPCSRGTYCFIDDNEVLLWTQGVVDKVSSNYYKEKKGIPSPLIIKRYAGREDIGQRCSEILGLTKMDWNNDSLYNKIPVTISYASKLAQILKRVPEASGGPYSLRFFI